MKILISTWGNPKTWSRVSYRYKDEEKKNVKDPLLLIKETEEIDKTIIVSIDTLFDETLFDENSIEVEKYEKVRERAEEVIKNFCIEEMEYTPDKIIISFGVGEFNKTKFIGNAMDCYFLLLKELSFTFTEWLKNDKGSEEIEIYLDISHGINFLPVLCYRALKEILQILSYSVNIKLTVLNSDTYIRSPKPANDTYKLNVNIIEEDKVLPRVYITKSDKNPIAPFWGLTDEEKKGINIILRNIKIEEKIFVFLSSFIFAIPHFVISYLPGAKNLEKKIKKIMQELEKKIEIIKPKNGKLEIKRKIQFTSNFENLIKAYILSWVLNKNKISQKTEISIEDIKIIKEKIWEKNFPTESNRIDVEIKGINEIKERLKNKWKSYASYLGKRESNQIDKRNFFAHAGFEHNIIKIRKNNDIIEIRINSKLKKEALNLLKGVLPRS